MFGFLCVSGVRLLNWRVVRRYLGKAVWSGAILGLVSASWITRDYTGLFFNNEFVKSIFWLTHFSVSFCEVFAIGWVCWTSVLVFVLPAVIDDNFLGKQ